MGGGRVHHEVLTLCPIISDMSSLIYAVINVIVLTTTDEN